MKLALLIMFYRWHNLEVLTYSHLTVFCTRLWVLWVSVWQTSLKWDHIKKNGFPSELSIQMLSSPCAALYWPSLAVTPSCFLSWFKDQVHLVLWKWRVKQITKLSLNWETDLFDELPVGPESYSPEATVRHIPSLALYDVVSFWPGVCCNRIRFSFWNMIPITCVEVT